MPSIDASLQPPERARAPLLAAASSLHENELRRRWVVVRNDSDQAALCVLLRFAGAEPRGTREKLRALGFEPSSSPASAPMSWRLRVSGEDLRGACVRLRDTLGGEVVLDLGASFVENGSRMTLRRARDAWYWPGPFLINVGGTRRSVLFQSTVSEAELDHALAEARGIYYAQDFHSATE